MLVYIFGVCAQGDGLSGLGDDVLVLGVEEGYESALSVEAQCNKLGKGCQAGLGARGEGLSRDGDVGVVEFGIRNEKRIVSVRGRRPGQRRFVLGRGMY